MTADAATIFSFVFFLVKELQEVFSQVFSRPHLYQYADYEGEGIHTG